MVWRFTNYPNLIIWNIWFHEIKLWNNKFQTEQWRQRFNSYKRLTHINQCAHLDAIKSETLKKMTKKQNQNGQYRPTMCANFSTDKIQFPVKFKSKLWRKKSLINWRFYIKIDHIQWRFPIQWFNSTTNFHVVRLAQSGAA